MKFSTISSTAFAVAVGVSSAPLEPRHFVPVPLEGKKNWIAGESLFPSEMIAGFHAELKNYTADTWSAYVLEKCKGFDACTSCISYSGNNSGSTGGRYWFGSVFRGGPTTVADYVRDETAKHGVADSIAQTIKS